MQPMWSRFCQNRMYPRCGRRDLNNILRRQTLEWLISDLLAKRERRYINLRTESTLSLELTVRVLPPTHSLRSHTLSIYLSLHFTMHSNQNIDPSASVNNFCQSMYTSSPLTDFALGDDGRSNSQHAHRRSRANTGRKNWKTLKSEKREAVWPDHLEEALLEALERYRPTSSKDPRRLRRFPRRNAFISEFIKRKTNVGRTPKQVGSRLQQLRETCTDQRVIRLIVSRDFDAPDRLAAAQALLVPSPAMLNSRTAPDLRINTSMPEYSPTSSNTTSAGLTSSLSIDSLNLDPYDYPTTPFSDDFEQLSVRSSPSAGGTWPHAYVHIDLVSASSNAYRQSSLESSTTFTLDLDESGLTDSPVLNGPEAWKWQRRMCITSAVPVCYHTPSVTFSSSILSPNVNYESLFRVQRGDKVVYEEFTQLELVSEPHCRPSLFRSSVLPKYWGTVSNKPSDLNQYMIIQDIYESAAATDRRIVDPIYTVVFNFDCSIPASEQNPSSQQHRVTSTPGGATSSSSPVSYFSSPPYEAAPLMSDDNIRIPLAPIMTNTSHLHNNTSSVGDLLNYDAVGDYGSMLPPINVVDATWFASGTYLQPPAQSQFYSANGVYNPGMQGAMDGEGFGYSNLYPF